MVMVYGTWSEVRSLDQQAWPLSAMSWHAKLMYSIIHFSSNKPLPCRYFNGISAAALRFGLLTDSVRRVHSQRTAGNTRHVSYAEHHWLELAN